ncbi:HD domain-containing phosphohydrolase [Paenibacillus radicis (ex Xue et al. 2023)]|uniref:Response regulator n=1 Tax=Paenibacillus radicis (ex Xue et al. 2023) TaxID=2972489 RepID=A0ABT1YNM2_9BACL|nr:HD domain-containing phosphohydrolase [Paenibacillus radicis (ex Xue et al. 2023)]MCR8634780.1 response regulator [Paenibacillus radicis (ex Xue et al. 2023)]
MDGTWSKLAKFLIVDDQEYNITLLDRILRRAGFSNLHSTMNSQEIVPLFQEIAPDIVLLDLHMPGIDGFEALKQLRELDKEGSYLPILVLTADVTPEAKKKALQEGANDFLTKPFDKTEVILRINNLLKTRYLYLQLQHQNEHLEERVRERTADLEKAQFEILHLLARTSEFRDDMTGQHTNRVGEMAGMIAQTMALSKQEVELIRLAAPLHDLGKIGIPDEILLKPGRFTPEEFEYMKSHTSIGASILEGSLFPVLKVAEEIAMSHHEKWDGTGYPKGLKGDEIPFVARIVALADFFDALTHERPYKRAWTVSEALSEIDKQRGLHFDPQIVDAFKSIVQKIGVS